MIIIRGNSKPIKCDTLTPTIKIGKSHHIIAIREATDRAFDETARKMTRSFNQRNERRSKR